MNDWNAILSDLISQFVVRLPEIIAFLIVVVTSLQDIKKKTATFPNIAGETKQFVTDKVAEIGNEFQSKFSKMSDEVLCIVEKNVDELVSKLDEKVVKISEEVEVFSKKYDDLKNQINTNNVENKFFIETICSLISVDPQKIKSGIATSIITKANLTKEEIEKYPQTLLSDRDLLVKVLIESKKLLGDDFNKMLEEVNEAVYGKKEE